ncbi:alpha/beta hydrolase [Agromyces sp. MMS24-JH15]|uniref:alpha/beta hydrolase n=1 Tax=Agromyces sp. MMS24-JH15 TaxID=3243765 RepID=UPI0037489CB3
MTHEQDSMEPIDVALSAAGHDFTVRVYRAEESNGTTLVWLHGGAFMFGDLEMPEADRTARDLAARGTTVVSVDYTLASLDAAKHLPPPEALPDFPLPDGLDLEDPGDRPRAAYPVASQQAAHAVAWAVEHAADWGGAPERVAIGGASAGGNLAAGAALRLRDGDGVDAFAQVLVYPVLHRVLPPMDADLERMMGELPGWMRFPPSATRAINANYLGGEPDAQHSAEPYAFPAGHDLRGAPRALVITAEADDLRPSAQGYVGELAQACVDVAYAVERGSTHGFLNMPGHPAQRDAIERIARFLAAEA